jgi:hypothetical protein
MSDRHGSAEQGRSAAVGDEAIFASGDGPVSLDYVEGH